MPDSQADTHTPSTPDLSLHQAQSGV
jgi:hypothetical protein